MIELGAYEHATREALIVTGPDRQSWLNGLVTADVTSLVPPGAAWGLALDKTGKVLSDLFLLATTEALLVSVAPGRASLLAAWLERMLVMEDAELAVSEGQRCVELFGADAMAVADRLPGLVAAAPFDRSGRLGGALLWTREADAAALRAALSATGVRLLDEAAYTELRVTELLPAWGVDYDASDNPHEASLDRRAVSWSKGCYLGQEVVCMQDMRGKVKRRLVRLEIAGPVTSGAEIRRADAVVGIVRSVAPGGDRVLASVRTAALDTGEALDVVGTAGVLSARPSAG